MGNSTVVCEGARSEGDGGEEGGEEKNGKGEGEGVGRGFYLPIGS